MNAEKRTALQLLSALGTISLLLATGCSTKNYVRSQTTPIIEHTNELDDKTAQNNRNIKDVDARAQRESRRHRLPQMPQARSRRRQQRLLIRHRRQHKRQ